MGQGEGVISDFIRLIPGNYEFTFWIRLQDIHSYQERRGTRIDDAIDIQVLFYDRNRLLISGETFNSRRNTHIDQSFKALPFAGFWDIDSLGWSQVTGRTTNDYLTDGDVPDEAKFAKIFFGLKGTGTMWIDDVDFRYSSRNFSSLEKSEHFFDTTFSAAGHAHSCSQRGCGTGSFDLSLSWDRQPALSGYRRSHRVHPTIHMQLPACSRPGWTCCLEGFMVQDINQRLLSHPGFRTGDRGRGTGIQYWEQATVRRAGAATYTGLHHSAGLPVT